MSEEIMTAVVIIPARYGSTRFPGKPLIEIAGKPLIRHVCERAGTCKLAGSVIVATDDERIYNTVLSFGGKAIMTSEDHSSGTDRIAEVAGGLDCDIVINVQGDEPLIRGEMIDEVVKLLDDDRAEMGTLVRKIDNQADILNPNVVKAVFDLEGFALYFSRAPIPFYGDEPSELRVEGSGLRVKEKKTQNLQPLASNLTMYKHIGIYSYRKDALLRLTGLPQSWLERAERLEQLRALENGLRIKTAVIGYDTISVDTPEDIRRVEEIISRP